MSGPTRDAGAVRGLLDFARDRLGDPPIEHRRHDVLGQQLVVGDDAGDRIGAAASFISSLMVDARQASAPRKMPGKHSTLLI